MAITYLSPLVPERAKRLSPEAVPSETHRAVAGKVYVAAVFERVTTNSISSPVCEMVKVLVADEDANVCLGRDRSIVDASVRAFASGS